MRSILTLLLVHAVSCLREGDQITSLPGWNAALKSRMFAGYIPCGEDIQGDVHYKMHEHYIFVESEGNPAKDPLIVWTNGGPGAASYFGLFVEVGPYYMDSSSLKGEAYNETGVPTLFNNEYGWTKMANLLIINSPPPVGYSYCEPAGPSGKAASCGAWNDSRTAQHNLQYLENWMKEFHEFQENDLYIMGESYGGIYVPTLVREILSYGSLTKRKLKGFTIVDGCVGTDVLCSLTHGPDRTGPGPYYHIKFLGGHHQISSKLYDQIMDECPRDQLIGYGTKLTDKNCINLITKASKQLGGMFAYSLYDTCWYENGLMANSGRNPAILNSGRNYWGPPTQEDAYLLTGALNDYHCGGGKVVDKWLTHPKVKKTLNVEPDAYLFTGDNAKGFPYTLSERNLLPFYKEVVENTDLRVLVINGDTDPTLDSLVAQNWTSSLGFEEKEEWRPWTIDGKSYMGGYVTRYHGDFDFLTVRGSGHMVPQYKARVADAVLRYWLKNEPWPAYTGPNSWPFP